MGYATVAIYSEADAGEPHTREADQAVLLPGVTPAETYLDIESVLAAAKETGADTIHPGYGFLAENASFARAVIEADLTWIGPNPAVIEIMGSKLAAKKLVDALGVPTLPSIELAGLSAVASSAMTLGFPVLVKASAGGGGKGMRLVSSPDGLIDAIRSAQREAVGAFGDGTLFLEKYLTAPRHIEIQVFGDRRGRVISLHERECSIQRRHQKVIEEAPSSALDSETRAEMSQAAIEVAESVGYGGAGTVEFLYQDDKFYFLEMNTRLQVEHAVTELVTGLDLVRLQFEVEEGLDLPGTRPRLDGHAIEARLYAEDPRNDYLPVTGPILGFEFPEFQGLRVDSAVEAGSTVTVHYDPMLAKVVAHASNRETATRLLASALRRAHIHGLTTNRELLVHILEHPEFATGETDTHFLQRNDARVLGRPLLDEAGERLASLAAAIADQAEERRSARVLTPIPSGWRNSPSQRPHRAYVGDHGTHDIRYDMSRPFAVGGLGTVTVRAGSPHHVALAIGDEEHRFEVARYGDIRHVDSVAGPARLVVVPRFPVKEAEEDSGSLHAPMPGRVIRVEVAVGDTISEGVGLLVMEAMKMEHTLRAPHGGTVSQVLCAADDQVEAGEILVVVDEA